MIRPGVAFAAVIASLSVILLGGCGDPPPREQKKLPVPKGESTLDDLIKKAQSTPAAPPAQGELAADSRAVRFGNVSIGETFERQVRITNDGNGPATVSQRHLAGQASAFRLGGNCADGQELAAGQSCTIDIVFHPLREGTSDAELVIGQGGVGSSLFVSLTGEAAAPVKSIEPAGTAGLSEAEASLIFARSRQDAPLAVEGGSDDPPAPRDARDPDYTVAGLRGIVSTFPVDRSRVITADRYIPAVLENTINSQLPGRAIAVVERNVYGASGRLVLIPAGSRVVGNYKSLARMGEARLTIDWSRIIRPDGVSINIDNQGADVMGRAGLPGELDTRFFEKYGSSLLTSAIAAAGDLVLDSSSTVVTSPLGGTTQNFSGRARAANRLGNDLDRLGQRMVEENVDIRPVLTVAQGTRLNIIPAEDIWLRDPNRLQAVTGPKGGGSPPIASNIGPAQLIPGLVDMVAQTPAVQRLAPQTAQQIMQASVLQQLRNGNFAIPTPPAAGSTALTGTGQPRLSDMAVPPPSAVGEGARP